MIRSRFESFHICQGYTLLPGSEPDLRDNESLWGQLWDRHRQALLPWWQAEHPAGSRPRAHWLFDRGMDPPDDERAILNPNAKGGTHE
jgi:hypothetical protein